jgi:DNA-binding CsgD family transcriptional regulator
VGKSQRLTLGQVREVFHLVGEIGECGLASDGWRPHALTTLCGLTGAQVGMCGVFMPDNAVHRIGGPVADIGWSTDRDRQCYVDYLAHGRCYAEPSYHLMVRTPRAAWARLRRQLVADAEYFRSDSYAVRRSGHMNEYLHSCQPWNGAGAIHCIQFVRPHGAPPFEPVHARLVRLFQEELARQLQLRPTGVPATDELSPRLREVLRRLLAGDGEKQVTAKLELSRHTVHQYVKALYRHFGVESRAELLALWVRQP